MAESGPIGLLGGTFDPVHRGHLGLAEAARQALGLPQVRWIPAGQPPHRGTPAVTAAQRVNMVRLAIADRPHFSLDDAEVRADQPSYTVLTLERLRRELGARQPLVLLMGADAFLGLPGWKRWAELFELAHIAVATRPGYLLSDKAMPPELAAQFHQRGQAALSSHPGLGDTAAGLVVNFPMPPLDISATAIRRQLAAGMSPADLLPAPVLAYIHQHHLYR